MPSDRVVNAAPRAHVDVAAHGASSAAGTPCG